MVIMLIHVGHGAHALMVAELGRTEIGFAADETNTILAEVAVHVRGAMKRLVRSILERLKHQGVQAEVRRGDVLDRTVGLGMSLGGLVHALDQDTVEQEVRLHNDPRETKAPADSQSLVHVRRGES
jgi:hypothetical protein